MIGCETLNRPRNFRFRGEGISDYAISQDGRPAGKPAQFFGLKGRCVVYFSLCPMSGGSAGGCNLCLDGKSVRLHSFSF